MRHPLIGYLLRAAALVVLGAVLMACRVLLVLVLRPIVTWPLLMGCLGGMGATAGFAASQMWADAMRAGFVTTVCALLFGLYAAAAQAIDDGHFDQVPSRQRRPWAAGGTIYDDAQ